MDPIKILTEVKGIRNQDSQFGVYSPYEDSRQHFSLPARSISPIIEPEIEIELDGSAAVGRVRIYKQVHTAHIETFATTRKIGEYQAQIYNHLIRTQPHHHFFFEGLQVDFPRCNTPSFSDYCYEELNHWIDLWNKTDRKNCASYIKEIFDSYRLDQEPNDTQLYYLGALGAPRIFAIYYADVSLHRTTDPFVEHRWKRALAHPRSERHPRVNECTDGVREHRALQEVKSFLRLNPGAEADLFYGSWHHFTRQAEKVFDHDRPLLVAYDWPDLAVQLGWPFASAKKAQSRQPASLQAKQVFQCS